MNSPKVVVSLGLALVFGVILTACGGSKSTPPPPAGPPTIVTSSLPLGAVNTPYYNGTGVMLSATGGTGLYTWSISSGSLPPGLTLNSTTAVIGGTPTTLACPGTGSTGIPCTYPFTVQVTDAKSLSSTANLSIYIEGAVTITPAVLPAGSMDVPYAPVQLMAAGGLPPYTWCVLNSAGTCDPAQAGLPAGLSLSATGVISGTPTTDDIPKTFMVQVSDSESLPGHPAVGSSPFTITIMSVTTTSLPQGSASVPYSATLTASGGVPFKGGLYNWSITAGSLPHNLTLDPTKGVISGTPDTIKVSNFTVQAADNEKPPAMATANLSISIAAAVTDANLTGNYAFNFSGYTSNGQLVVMAGAFFANGDGTFKAVLNSQNMLCGAVVPLSFTGCLDYNDGSGEPPGGNNPVPQYIVAAQSSYLIQPNGLGTMTLVTNSATYNFNVAITSNGSGSLILDSSTTSAAYGSGTLKSQNTSNWPLCGSNFAVGLFGVDSASPPARYAAAGAFQFDPKTCVDAENGVMDIDDGGNSSNTTFTGAFNQFDSATGRGIAGVTLKGGGRHFFAFYFVSSSDHKKNELILVSTDPTSQAAALTLWSGLQQANFPTGWDNSRLAGTAVAELNAVDTNGAADVTSGLFDGNGVAGNTCQGNNYDSATFSFDENQGGTTNSSQQTSTGTYCIDKITGRVTLTPFNTGPFATPPVFYMVTANQAFVVGTDPAITSGYLEPQLGSPFSTLSIFGLYSGGTVTPVLPAVTNAVTSLYADGIMNMNGMQDTSGPGGPMAPPPFTYTYTADNTGRAVVKQSDGATVGIMYVVSAEGSQTAPAKTVMLPVTDPGGKPDTNPVLSVFNATVQ